MTGDSEQGSGKSELFDLISAEHRPAHKCDDCRAIWYGPDRSTARRQQATVDEVCPSCGSPNVVEPADLPGALLLEPWVNWPEDCPWRSA